MNPITQSVMAIHACRSISAPREAIHKQNDLNGGAPNAFGAKPGRPTPSHFSAAQDRDPVRPRDDNDKDGAIPATFREENRASRALQGSRPNRSVGNGIRSPVHQGKTTRAKRAIDNHEPENARARASGR